MIKKIILIFLFLLLSAVLLLGIWYLIKIEGWPLWIGGAILIGIFGILLGSFFVKRYLLRANEKKFVKRVIAQEGNKIAVSEEEDALLLKDLEAQWEKSIQTLYHSKLNKGKNPIYALPWILVIGESRAGKTSLIKNSRLASIVTDVKTGAPNTGTKNCDWWFFKDAIILDSAGRYTIPIEERRDNLEWERFLSLLSKYRKEEPLNGMVVVVSAERLLENDKDLMQEEALNIRKRIDQLMVTIGAKFPIYLMVTKMDRIYGFTDFCDALPEELQSQAMGYLNESLNTSWKEVITKSVEFIKEKITMLQLLSMEHKRTHSKEILLFSKEFDRIIPALKDFSRIAFGDNPYQKIPMLRGVYFSSALTDGKSDSKFLSDYNLAKKMAPAQNKAYFIADFFKVILPGDRNVFSPIKEYLVWQRRNYKIAIVSWLFIFLSITGIYAYSYLQNVSVIKNVEAMDTYTKDFQKMDLTSRLFALDKLRLDIEKIDALNKNIVFSFLKFEQSQKSEIYLKNLFYKEFNVFLARDFLFKMNKDINHITDKTPSRDVVSYIGFLIDNINILRQVLENKQEVQVSKRFSTWITNILFAQESKIEPSVSFLFVKNYINFLTYNTDRRLIKEQIKTYQNLISLIVERKGADLHWLMDKGVSQVSDITMGTFFKGIDESKFKKFPTIPGALTQKGRSNLKTNIDIMAKEIGNKAVLKADLAAFWKWYDIQFYYRWKNFAISFNNINTFLKLEKKEQILYKMVSVQNPYFDFIHILASELKAYKSSGITPQWVKLVIEGDDVMSIAEEIRNSKNSLLSKVDTEKNKLIANAQDKIDKNGYIKKIKSAGIFNLYIKDLTQLSKVIDKKESKMLLSDFFTDSVDHTPLSPSFSECQADYKQFIHTLPQYANASFVYKLFGGPKNYIIEYAISQMSKILNSAWENDVLGLLPLSSEHDRLMSLFNKEKGLVWKYVNKELKPFVVLNQYGYSAKNVEGYMLDIDPEFLRYINSGINLLGAYKPTYDLSITAFPFDVNKAAKIRPNYVKLHLRCSKEDYILNNENYRLTRHFSWVPSKCGDTVLTFGFNSFRVKKTYRGENGFLHFLRDFRAGTKFYHTNEFDETAPELKQNNIRYIKVSYNISNEGEILKLLDKTPYEIPKKVIKTK